MILVAVASQSGEQSAVVWLVVLGGVVAMALALYGLDRWYTKRYGRSTPGVVTRAGAAMFELQSLLEPGKRHVAEVKRRQLKKDADAGDDPEPIPPPEGSHPRS